jgi:hypothetical protein
LLLPVDADEKGYTTHGAFNYECFTSYFFFGGAAAATLLRFVVSDL